MKCRVSGCGRKIYDGSKTGVCQAHNHHPVYCLCSTCIRRRGGTPPPEPPELPRRGRWGNLAPITLPPAPWENDD